jgi:hypothetical protein
MSDTQNGRGKTERLDVAIDRAVREMLDIEPRADLRGRVLDRISNVPVASGFRRKGWIFAPIAAAALILLAVTLPWRSPRTANPSSGPQVAPQVVRTTPPSVAPQTVPSAAPRPRPAAASSTSVAIARSPRSQGIRAALANDEPVVQTTAADRTQVAALDGPVPLVIQQLTGPPSSAMKSIEVAPMRVAALEVNALSEVPRER